MTLVSNLPVTSREYKLILNPGEFIDRETGSEKFWNILSKITDKTECNIIKYTEEFERITWYLDTPKLSLSKLNYILRLRDEGENYKIMLKYRNPDRYLSASKNLNCNEENRTKFEEDILPPFESKFSHSSSFKTKELPRLVKFKHASALFPGLEELEIKNKLRLKITNDFRAFEISRWIGAFDFGNNIPVKACLNFWYKSSRYKGVPLIAEFSFDYDMEEAEEELPLESYPLNIVNKAYLLFIMLQKKNAFTKNIQFSKTKTNIAYNLM